MERDVIQQTNVRRSKMLPYCTTETATECTNGRSGKRQTSEKTR